MPSTWTLIFTSLSSCEGRTAEIEVYSPGERVELFLNGKTTGEGFGGKDNPIWNQLVRALIEVFTVIVAHNVHVLYALTDERFQAFGSDRGPDLGRERYRPLTSGSFLSPPMTMPFTSMLSGKRM